MPCVLQSFKLRFARLTLLAALGFATLPTQAGNVVTINADNVLVINGRKVFPIGFTLAPEPEAKTPTGKNGLQELADAGATFMRTGANGQGNVWDEHTFATEKAWEDAAAAHGLYCWLYLHDLASIKKGDTNAEAKLRRVVNEFKDNPGFGIWKGADEPEWGKAKVDRLVRCREIVRELDTNHPLTIIQAPRGTVDSLRPYNPAGDITGCDIYPIGYPPGANSLLTNKEMSMVGDYTRTMMAVSEGKQPVWMVLQFAWSGVVGPGKTLRFPTFFEERFMAYDAIINGARGLLFFGGNIPKAMSPRDAALGWNWTFWDRVLKNVMEEVGTHSPLEDALVAPESKLPVHVSDAKGIEFCVRESGDDLYIIAARRSGATAEVKFTDLPVAYVTSELMFESPRNVNVAGGKFTDWFAPYEVHVYHFKLKK